MGDRIHPQIVGSDPAATAKIKVTGRVRDGLHLLCEGLVTRSVKQEHAFSFLCPIAAAALALHCNFLLGWRGLEVPGKIHSW